MDMLKEAKKRGFEPEYVIFDSWYTALDNLKLVRALGWHFFARFKENRQVDPDRSGNRAVSELVDIPQGGIIVHLKGFGMVSVFRTVSRDGGTEHWATDDLRMDSKARDMMEKKGWGIEVYHRGIKQCCGVERAHVRNATAITTHILMSLRAFIRLEVYRLRTRISWYEAKTSIIRDAIRAYLARPLYPLGPTA